ncbi:hypothetical protein JCM11251_002337 [Rhodosporidiobolus azoricus]
MYRQSRGQDHLDVILRQIGPEDTARPMWTTENVLLPAFVGLYSEVEATEAIATFEGLAIDSTVTRAAHFKDRATGSTVARLLVAPERRYVDPNEQARRPPSLRRLGLFVLHLPPMVDEASIVRFLERSISRRDIRAVHIKHAGFGTHAFIGLHTAEAGKRAIAELDGELLSGFAVRVAWEEPDRLWMTRASEGADSKEPLPPQRNRTDFSPSSSRPSQSAFSPTNLQALSKNRHAALAGSSDSPPAPPSPVSPSFPPACPDERSHPTPLWVIDSTPPRLPLRSANPIKVEVDEQLPRDPDLVRLESLGLPSSIVESLRQCWEAYDETPCADFRRQIEGEVSFGSLPSDRAGALLEAHERDPPRADDLMMQNRWEAFLKAQTGESKDWYTVFFAKLMQFNREAEEFSQKARETAKLRMEQNGTATKVTEVMRGTLRAVALGIVLLLAARLELGLPLPVLFREAIPL